MYRELGATFPGVRRGGLWRERHIKRQVLAWSPQASGKAKQVDQDGAPQPFALTHWQRPAGPTVWAWSVLSMERLFMGSSTFTGLPWWLSSKESACNAGDTEDVGSIPGSRRCPGGRHGNPLQYTCLENPMDWGAWWATVHSVSRSRTRLSDRTHTYARFTETRLSPGLHPHHQCLGQTPQTLAYTWVSSFPTGPGQDSGFHITWNLLCSFQNHGHLQR